MFDTLRGELEEYVDRENARIERILISHCPDFKDRPYHPVYCNCTGRIGVLSDLCDLLNGIELER